jgi:hypothetical protein
MSLKDLAPRRPGIAGVIGRLHREETHLARTFLAVSARHLVEHEIHFVAADLAGWSQEHVRRLADAGRAHGVRLEPESRDPSPWVAQVRRAVSRSTGRARAPGLLLLDDLRDAHSEASCVSLGWEVLAQSAQAAEDADLLALASGCHPQTLRQLRWTNAQVKELAAQAVLST